MADKFPCDWKSACKDAARAVEALWGYSRKLSEVKPLYCYFSGADFEMISSKSREYPAATFRNGLVFLLLKGIRVPRKEVAPIIRKGYDPTTASWGASSFEDYLKNFGIKLPAPPIIPYAERIVCRVLTHPGWSDIKTSSLLEVYSKQVGTTEDDLRKGGTGVLLATQRAGFAYLASEMRGFGTRQTVEDFGFEFDRSTLAYGIKRIRGALETYREIAGVKVPLPQNSHSAGNVLKFVA